MQKFQRVSRDVVDEFQSSGAKIRLVTSWGARLYEWVEIDGGPRFIRSLGDWYHAPDRETAVAIVKAIQADDSKHRRHELADWGLMTFDVMDNLK